MYILKITIQIILIHLLLYGTVAAQEFSKQQQYQQAMANAKMAFNAKMYSEAIVFYREALIIKPDAQLPRYKIEDIRTIYIEKELKKIEVQPAKKAKKDKKQQRKQIEPDAARILAEKKADQIIEEETKAVKAEFQELKIESKAIEIDNEEEVVIDSEKIENLSPDRDIILPKKEIILQNQLDTEIELKPEITARIDEKPIVADNNTQKTDSLPTKKNEIKKDSYQPQKSAIKASQMSDEEKKAWVKQEKERLKTIYPNKKTVEEIDKPGKHITRVIMNINNDVMIYLKVKHSWGGLYFFIDNPGDELRSISEQYYNQMTNLETYGN